VSDAVGAAAGYCGVLQYPTELEDQLMLPNGSDLRIRPLRPWEDHAIRELDRHLSVRTRYLRFLSAMPELPDSLLRLITSVDYHQRLALLAESDTDPAAVVALSEFIAIDDRTAEVGLMVRDDWQRQGLGTALASRTLLAAEVRGFDRFVAQVLYDNIGVMRLLHRVGVVISTKTRGGVSEITFVRKRRRHTTSLASS
jgi:acetyltransferase